MGNACGCGGGNGQDRASAVQISTTQTVYPHKTVSAPEKAMSYLEDIGDYTVEVAFQRAQGRRDHQEDYLSLCSLRSKNPLQYRRDHLLGVPQPFNCDDVKTEGDPNDESFDTHWCAVFDGHGGHTVSEHCARTMQNLFLKHLSLLPQEKQNDEEAIRQVLIDIFLTIDEEIRELPPSRETIYKPSCFGQGTPMELLKRVSSQGCTATVAAMKKLGKDDVLLSIAHSGDSRLILFSVENIPITAPDDLVDDAASRKSSKFRITSNVSRWMGGSEPASSVFGSYFRNSQVTETGNDGLSHKQSLAVRKILRGKLKRHVTEAASVKSKLIHETLDHQPSNASEAQRVIQLGGQVINSRVNGVLAVSRALGDHDQKAQRGLSADPDTFNVRLSDVFDPPLQVEVDKDEEDVIGRELIVVLASDGLWNYFKSSDIQGDVVEMLSRGYNLKEACQVLMDKVIIDFRGVDNTSIAIMRITKSNLQKLREDRVGDKDLINRMKKNNQTGTMRSYGSVGKKSFAEVQVESSGTEEAN